MFFRLQEWFWANGYVPTIEQMKDVYNLPDETHQDYEDKKKFLLWYLDKYLPAAAGEASYGKTVRLYSMAIDRKEIRGKQRVLVESASEAFGWLLLENCYEKWSNICNKKKENPGWKVPKNKKNDPSTHPYNKCKWTDSSAGQGGGWAPGARLAFEENKEIIKTLRKKDHAENWKLHKFCLQLLREEHGVTEDAPLPPGAKKCKRPATKKGSTEDDFKEMDNDSDSAYSVHSEISAGEHD